MKGTRHSEEEIIAILNCFLRIRIDQVPHHRVASKRTFQYGTLA